MRLRRVGEAGAERPIVSTGDGRWLDASGVVPEYGPATIGSAREILAAEIAAGGLPEVDPTGLRVGAPISRPGKIVCIGVNYLAHAQETQHAEPAEPVMFLKTSATIVGPYDDVLIPRGSVATDYEVELAAVIGCTARYLDSAEQGLACVAGYTVSNDVSERDFQMNRGGTWDKGKNCETFNPLGPELVTADEIPDPQLLDIRLTVNGEVRQRANTAQMIFGVGEIVRYLSQFMVLEPGDVVNTGTPAGVAFGYPDPKPYLRRGDVIETHVDVLGGHRSVLGEA
ncbi:5-carboxymethyl-2-hydroxymuconateDelta-isomerase OS=Tsukamurella paurometabola (strain ATCC 8368 /DSM / CCUG 35730 / CIP 100753 / JCM 10117 / KCTC 9821/ NBRC 16120 / NCIMB 702349 / NCTC 13040) OX=521096 GN=Tpau_0759 PE=4 SV=1 [Tsukamurella paurometabola]|uniref:5-carboxymethyl-2-hydroxymuconateDelta-isomerase n=1 Tax=Tsukamurella paurometabola (strain ATCC 8368 / DSM 20162 / CCUG 35730 / CIP 100753 / JCM 10117 / KCTC 9821 / NBRC 16120 / NCIMB 702349 / NCTC 13040) TaxID=521096 RepID=D5UTP2_TSUPD|nr:fumarylacetoacetate hydrolase family protein [Tsukamurella paurometabola]ADG77396.1 5-carboxymethyl-2-hydroxymuconateDelta-isomerase [Tsukamurella paurometabola DSM 20162]SUP26873.1 Ureidoglycolate lyase [Tsukamurella paurometabola]